jgi:hypothetical protein
MKIVHVVLFFALACTQAQSQIQVGVWTDKPFYIYGDTVAVTITAYNPGSDTVILDFPSACQVSYTIDDFNFINHVGCATVLTARTISPFGTVQWDYLRYPSHGSGWPVLAQGSHSITGEVLGYATSDTLVVFVQSSTSVSERGIEIRTFVLGQNYPNPFNGTTVIPFTLSAAGKVQMTLYNLLGQRIRTLLDSFHPAGSYKVQSNLNELPSGSYWCRLQMGARSQTTKLILSK